MVAADYAGFYAESAEHTVAIMPRELSKPAFNGVTLSKGYDGTTEADFLISLISGFYGSGSDEGTEYRFYPNDYEVNSMQYDSPDAGDDRKLEYDITLKNENYKAVGGGMRLKGSVAASISKIVASTPSAGTLTIANDQKAEYTFDFKSLLPELTAPQRYGKIEYKNLDVTPSNSGYYDSSNEASITEDGVLTLPIKANSSGGASVLKVTVNVTTQNYVIDTGMGMSQLTLNVNAVNKKMPTLDGNIRSTRIRSPMAIRSIRSAFPAR